MNVNAHHKIFLAVAGTAISILITLAVIVSSIAYLPHDGTVRAAVAHPVVTVPAQPAPPSALLVAQMSENAVREMHARAANSLHGYIEVPQSLGATGEWSDGWVLQWLDVERDGATVRIYHATDMRWPERRFVAVWNDGVAKWEKVH